MNSGKYEFISDHFVVSFIRSIEGDKIVSYEGERTREDIEDFVYKAVGYATVFVDYHKRLF